jgi:hypothetical protein
MRGLPSALFFRVYGLLGKERTAIFTSEVDSAWAAAIAIRIMCEDGWIRESMASVLHFSVSPSPARRFHAAVRCESPLFLGIREAGLARRHPTLRWLRHLRSIAFSFKFLLLKNCTRTENVHAMSERDSHDRNTT